jgi:hypothetical protein
MHLDLTHVAHNSFIYKVKLYLRFHFGCVCNVFIVFIKFISFFFSIPNLQKITNKKSRIKECSSLFLYALEGGVVGCGGGSVVPSLGFFG